MGLASINNGALFKHKLHLLSFKCLHLIFLDMTQSIYYELRLTEALQINQEIGIELPQQCVMLHLMPQIVSIC